MPGSSSVRPAVRTAFRSLGGFFALATAGLLALVVAGVTRDGGLRTDLLALAIYTGATAGGLLGIRRWGRSMALLFGLGNLSIAILWLVSVFVAPDAGTTDIAGPLAWIGVNAAILFAITRSWFALPVDG